MTNFAKRQLAGMSYPRLIALGYAILILAGACLLCLPPMLREGHPSFLTGLFTATSATCVTGLVVVDTWSHWTLAGQIVILALIQVGGLGFMTILAMFSMFTRKKIGLHTRYMLKESVNTQYIGGIVRLYRKIIMGTILFEGTGAILLSSQFIPRYGLARGIWYGIFHSISAFCNAGFDLMGGTAGPYSSLVGWNWNPLVCLTIPALIFIGGIGFFVWDDVWEHRFSFRKYRLHSKVCLTMTAILIVGGTILFYFAERFNTLAGMPFGQQLMLSLFSSVTPRTAGFNVIDTARLGGAGKMLTMLLMFIGGASGGTAGGVKVTTIAVVLVCAWSSLRGTRSEHIFGRRFEDDALRRASAVVAVYLCEALTSVLLICLAQPELSAENVFFEVLSALSTVGLSVGVTGVACSFSQIILILLMYAGRVGSLSFILLFTERKNPPAVECLSENINIG